MKARGFATATIDELPRLRFDDPGGPEWRPLRRHLGIRAFGTNVWFAQESGEQVIERHDEAGFDHEELYFVVAGEATFRVGDEEVAAPAGTFLVVSDPALTREAVARAPGTTVLSVGAAPGRAFEVGEWEERYVREARAS